MKKFLLVLILIVLSVAIGLNWNRNQSESIDSDEWAHKKVLLRFALVSDSEDENDLLAKALSQAQGTGVNFVIGLGDFTSLGTLDQLMAAKKAFDDSNLTYYLTVGDRDLWDSRNQGEEATTNFTQIFGEPTRIIYKDNLSLRFSPAMRGAGLKEGIRFVILDNSDIYKGIDESSLQRAASRLQEESKLRFVFAHKTPFHPQSAHVMGEQSAQVARQAKEFLSILENNNVDGFFSGDLHFFAQFNSPSGAVKMTTVGAVNASRNFQGSRFAIVTVYNDYSWEVEDVEIR